MAKIVENEKDAIFAEEAFVVDVQNLLFQMMEEKGVSKADLARGMGVSRARISQIFSDECKNFTVKLLARAMFALDEKPEMSCKWSRDQAEAQLHCEQAAAVNSSINVHRLWAETNTVEDAGSPCNDGDSRIGMLLKGKNSLTKVAA